MATTYVHHRLTVAPRQWRATADAIAGAGRQRLQDAGGALYGVWRSQIGRPRDELTVMTCWSQVEVEPQAATAATAERALTDGLDWVTGAESMAMVPTLRPTDDTPPTRQGNYAFRWFETPPANFPEFLDLCGAAWPTFEGAYDSQVIGLWRGVRQTGVGHAAGGQVGGSQVKSLLLTRRPNLAMWERSKLPEGADEAAMREKLSRRYDLCDWTVVYTTTLLTAEDAADNARWT